MKNKKILGNEKKWVAHIQYTRVATEINQKVSVEGIETVILIKNEK